MSIKTDAYECHPGYSNASSEQGCEIKKEFFATKLISARQIRFNSTRQIGASLLVGLMLLCSGLLSGSILSYSDYSLGDHEAFRINASSSWYYDGHIGLSNYTSISKQSLS